MVPGLVGTVIAGCGGCVDGDGKDGRRAWDSTGTDPAPAGVRACVLQVSIVDDECSSAFAKVECTSSCGTTSGLDAVRGRARGRVSSEVDPLRPHVLQHLHVAI